MQIKKLFAFVPNTITSLNVLSGSLAIVSAFEGQLEWTAWFIIAAAIFDFFDGMSARLLGAHSDIGKELDSLADVISFGLAPSVVAYFLNRQFMGITEPFLTLPLLTQIKLAIPFIIVIFSALRLAKFNLDTRQTSSFIGLPTPANALFFISLIFITQEGSVLNEFFSAQTWVFYLIILAMSLVLVAEIPLFAFKFKNLSWRDNWFRFVFAAISLLLFPLIGVNVIPLMILIYIASGVVTLLVNRNNTYKAD